MPYRRAHWWLLALLPTIAFAFWPNYVSQLRTAPFALHAHGLTATAWIVLAAAQSWSTGARRLALHRTLGLATFAIVPLFAAGGALAFQAMIALHVAAVTPFHVAYGARLASADAVAATTFVLLVALALRWRRNVHAHGAAMLSSVLLVLPPVIARAVPRLPGFPDAIAGLSGFELGFHAGMGVSIVLPLALALRYPRGRVPFAIVALASALQMLLFETVARVPIWSPTIRAILAVPPTLLALGAFAVTAVALWLGWRRRGAGRPAAAPLPA